jgi:hypothetical protein
LDEILPPDMPSQRRHLTALSIVAQFVYFRAARNVIEMLVGDEELRDHHGAEQIADHIIRVSFAMLGLGPPLGDASGGDDSTSRTRLAVKTTERNEGAERLEKAQQHVSNA